MPVVSNSLQYTISEWAYLCYHCGFRQPDLGVAVAIPRKEGNLHSGAYRTALNNPGIPATVPKNYAGHDWSSCMINDYFWKQPDPFTLFDTLGQIRRMRSIFLSHGWTPWSYGSSVPAGQQRPDIELALVNEEIGDDPYDIANSPYWRMYDAGIDVGDLPVPPVGEYVSRLPAPPLSFGMTSPPGSDPGDRVHQLGLILLEDHLFTPGVPYWYYGNSTRNGVRLKQQELAAFGLWTGPTDGQYSVAFHAAWDGLLRFVHLAKGR